MFNFNRMNGFNGGSPVQRQASNPFLQLAAGNTQQPQVINNTGGGVARPDPGQPGMAYAGGSNDFNESTGKYDSGFVPGGAPAGGLGGALAGGNAPTGPSQDMISRLMALLQQGGGGGGSPMPGAAPPAPSYGAASRQQMPPAMGGAPAPAADPAGTTAYTGGGIPSSGGTDMSALLSRFGLNR